MHEKLQRTTIETLRIIRNVALLGGVALAGAEILPGKIAPGLEYAAIGSFGLAVALSGVISHDKQMNKNDSSKHSE